MNQQKIENPLSYKSIPSLLKGFAIPSIIAMLVSSLYNIVDQIFIGQGVGYRGNAATNVSYPLTTICLAIALLIGIGSASRFSLYLGAGEKEKAKKVIGNGICMMIVFGIIYMILCKDLFLYCSCRHALPYYYKRYEQSRKSRRKPQIFYDMYADRRSDQHDP